MTVIDTAAAFCLYETAFGTGAVLYGPTGPERVCLPSGDKGEMSERIREASPRAQSRAKQTAREAQELEGYFAGRLTTVSCFVDNGTRSPFARRVFQAVRAIPYGETRSYQWVAAAAGSPRGARAVGRVLANNPFVAVVPCHRVVRKDGKLGGWSGEKGWKERLLAIEQQGLRVRERTKTGKTGCLGGELVRRMGSSAGE